MNRVPTSLSHLRDINLQQQSKHAKQLSLLNLTMMSSNTNNPLPNTIPSSFPKQPSSTTTKKERRRAKRKANGSRKDDAPMFLRKAYHIVDTCDPEVAAWSEDGQSFFVKDQDRFATEVIPKCFKHNHFSSFVRQLNFYGFRKLREDHVELESVDEAKSKWCHFRHPKFQRGRPNLLKEISKNTHKEVAEKTELDALRSEVRDLKAVIKNMKEDMGILASLVGDLGNHVQSSSGSDPSGQSALKKQRLSSLPVPSTPPASNKAVLPSVPTTKPAPFTNTERAPSQLSTVSFTSEDENFLTSLFTEEGFEGDLSLPDEVVSSF